MAQYTIISEGSPLDIIGGTGSFRYIVISGAMHLRQTKTETGFTGSEGVDWDDIDEYADSGGGVWRVGVRDLHWRLDCTITGIDFSGDENTDWENIAQFKL
ncbi:hypothetical protein LCGC14_1768890 [marine sediment metagenome]|uniref:Uncharacterized protein n=1 Tax=marine sediment metagenome TaxID=412755 RepID=A0A0F9GYT9_9ZZZZ